MEDLKAGKVGEDYACASSRALGAGHVGGGCIEPSIVNSGPGNQYD